MFSMKAFLFLIFFALPLQCSDAKQMEKNQMQEVMKANLPNLKVSDVSKTMTSGTAKIKKAMTKKLPNFKVSTPVALPSGIAPVPSIAVQSPGLSVPSISIEKKKTKMDKVKTNEPSGLTAIPTSPSDFSVASPSPPPIFLQTKKMTKNGSGMGMAKDPSTSFSPTNPPSATPVPSNTIPSTSPVPSYIVPTSSLGMGQMM